MRKEKPGKPRVVDLFSGCGGLSLGFQNAGYDIQVAYDNWDKAISVYNKNFKHAAESLDLSNTKLAIEKMRKYKPEVIIGGPPCQDFSIAGKRQEAARANLTVAFAKIAAAVEPRAIVMENVYSIERSVSLQKAIQVLRKSNYQVATRIIDSSLTGVPQKRRRFFLIALRDIAVDPVAKALDENLSLKPLTVKDHFGSALSIKHYYAHPRSYKRRAVFSVDEPSSTIRRVNRPPPKNYVAHPADTARVTSRVRALTTSERAAIQTFPQDFVWLGSRSDQEHLIANAVPVKLAEYVAKQLLASLRPQ